jgi:release factor glutamine methyltransferase
LQKKSINDYYKPAEDTLFISDYLKNEKGEIALDIGTGSGFLAQVLSKNFKSVVATDIIFSALQKAHETVENCICCNAADAINKNFDLIVCNLPYLPSNELSDPAVDGLKEGVEIPSNIIKSASPKIKKNGKLVLLTSSLADHLQLIKIIESQGFDVRIAAKKKLFFEELILLECTKTSNT